MPEASTLTPAMLSTLHDLVQPITIHYYTTDVESWYSLAERQLLSAIASATAAITLHVHPDRWDAQREARLGIARTPAIALHNARDTGIRYYGMPDGYELETFVQILKAVASDTASLRAESLEALQGLTQPVHLEVLVSPT